MQKRYGYNGGILHYLFHSFIMSLFTYDVSAWACASYSECLCKIMDKLQQRAVRFRYLKYTTPIKDLIKQSDARLWADINSNSKQPLACLLSPKRNRIWREKGHPHILLKIKT